MVNHYNCIYVYIAPNGKKYVGKAKNFLIRHKQHIYESENEHRKSYNYPFHCAIRKYGIDNFTIKILAENISDKKIGEYEKFFIKRYKTISPNGYNIAEGGEGGNNMKGKTKEEIDQWKNNLSESVKKTWTDDKRNDISNKYKGEGNPNYGNHYSEETKKKISDKRKGKCCGENHPNYGKHHSEEIKEKMRKPKSEEAKKKISETRKGKYKGKNHPGAKKVMQFDLNMNLIKIYDCTKDVSDEFNWNNRTFRNHLDGRRSHEYKGFIWYYADEIE